MYSFGRMIIAEILCMSCHFMKWKNRPPWRYIIGDDDRLKVLSNTLSLPSRRFEYRCVPFLHYVSDVRVQPSAGPLRLKNALGARPLMLVSGCIGQLHFDNRKPKRWAVETRRQHHLRDCLFWRAVSILVNHGRSPSPATKYSGFT